MTQPTGGEWTPESAGPGHDLVLIKRLDRALLRLRHALVRPDISSVPIPALQRTVDLAKVLACVVIADLSERADTTRPVTVKDVAQALTLEHSTVSRLLSETEAEGFVTRSTDPADRRRTVVTLTGAGESLAAQSSALRTWSLRTLLAEWPASDVGALTELVERFGATIESRSGEVLQMAVDGLQRAAALANASQPPDAEPPGTEPPGSEPPGSESPGSESPGSDRADSHPR